jgi:hypothetical protein
MSNADGRLPGSTCDQPWSVPPSLIQTFPSKPLTTGSPLVSTSISSPEPGSATQLEPFHDQASKLPFCEFAPMTQAAPLPPMPMSRANLGICWKDPFTARKMLPLKSTIHGFPCGSTAIRLPPLELLTK